MFENIGKKIKGLVEAVFVIMVVIAIITALVGIAEEESIIVIEAILSAFIAWISLFALYGFGELIDNSQKQIKQNRVIIELLSNGEIITDISDIYNDEKTVNKSETDKSDISSIN